MKIVVLGPGGTMWWALGLLATASVVVLSACSAASVVQMESDYPVHTQRSLFAEASLIMEGKVVATESTVLKPRFEGDSPQDNPLLGLSEEEKKAALTEDDGVVATAVTVEVGVVHRGSAKSGQTVTIVQTGGVLEGVTYQDGSIAILDVGSTYLLFGGDGFDGAYYILGGAAGTYRSVGDGLFQPVDPDMAPFEQLRTSEIEEMAAR